MTTFHCSDPSAHIPTYEEEKRGQIFVQLLSWSHLPYSSYCFKQVCHCNSQSTIFLQKTQKVKGLLHNLLFVCVFFSAGQDEKQPHMNLPFPQSLGAPSAWEGEAHLWRLSTHKLVSLTFVLLSESIQETCWPL